MKSSIKTIMTGAALMFGIAQQAQSALVTDLVFKLSDSTPDASKLDAYTGWTNAGGFNEANATAKVLNDNGLDFKSTLVDTWPTDMTNVRVAMYSNGNEVAYIDFNPAGTTNTNFFASANVAGSNWTDLGDGGNYFSIAGHVEIDRHWFINNNYGGCGVDVGQLVVIDGDGSQPCGWERNRLGGNDRAFLYSTQPTEVNWNGSTTVGVADVFAVFVTRDTPPNNNNGQVPAPATLALLGLGLGGMSRLRRKRSEA